MRKAWALVLGGLTAWAAYLGFGHTLVRDAYEGRSTFPFLNRMIEHAAAYPLESYFRKTDTLALFVLFALFTTALYVARLARPGRVAAVTDLFFYLGCVWLGVYYLTEFGMERGWNLFADTLTFNGRPPIRHRILFALPARAALEVFSGWTLRQAYFFSQTVAWLLALWAVKRWAGLFIAREFAFVAQFLLVLIWAPTLDYYTLYDVGILFMYSFCLYHLVRGNAPWPYLAVFAVGPMIHELSLFLIPVSAVVLWNRIPKGRWVRLLLAQAVIYVVVRAALFYLLPMERAYAAGRPEHNLNLFFHRQEYLFRNVWHLLVWHALAAYATRYAPGPLKRCWVLLPCLLLMTYIAGQFNEARQLDAFFPVIVALMVCWLEAMRLRSGNVAKKASFS